MSTAALARALTAEVPEDSDHILDAALALAAASGLRHLTMDDVARRAGVGRMTVYRRFGSRDALLDALAGREARRCLAELEAASPIDAPLEVQLSAGFETALRLIREHPLLARLARVEPDSVLHAFTTRPGGPPPAAPTRSEPQPGFAASGTPGELLELCTVFLADRFERMGMDADPQLAELLVRVAISFILLPDTRVEDASVLLPLVQRTAAP